jgi:protein-tyrosine phosphatase
VTCESDDFKIIRYCHNLYTKANCKARTILDNENIFEADEILNGLYIGNILSVYDKTRLQDIGITHIISVIEGFVPPYPDDFNYLVINALDNESTKIIKNFESSTSFINDAFENEGKVLVHCMAGRSRSVTIVAAYIIDRFGINAKTTLQIIKSRRPIIEPNSFFTKQLEYYYDSLYIDRFEL